MTGKNELFAIVHSLTKSECASVRTGLVESERGLELFNAIKKQKTPDNEALKRLFPDQGISAFRSMKSWVGSRIVEILILRKGVGEDIEISILVAGINFLIGKNILSKAEKQLEKAEKIVESREDFYRHLDLLDLKKELAVAKLSGKELRATLEAMSGLSKELYEKLKNRSEYEEIWDIIRALPRGASPEISQELAKIESNPLVKSPNCKSKKAKLIHLRIQQWIAKTKGRYVIAADFTEQLVNFLELNSELLEESKSMLLYWDSVFSWGIYLLQLKEFEKVLIPMAKMRKPSHGLEGKSEWLVWGKLRFLELWYLSQSRQFEEAKSLIGKIEKELPDLGVIPQNEYLSLISMSCTQLIILGEYKRAIIGLFQLLNPEIHRRADLLELSKVLILVCYYSLNSFETLDRELALNQRRKKKNRYGKRFGFVMNFLSKTVKIPLSERKIEEKVFLKQIREQEITIGAQNYFDWQTWILSQIEGRRMMDIYLTQRSSI